MAKIILRIDATNTNEVSIPDQKLLSQVDLAVSAWNGPSGGTTIEKLGFIADKFKWYLLEVAKGEKRRQRQEVMEAQLVQDSTDLSGRY